MLAVAAVARGEDEVEKLEAKLAQPFVKNADWAADHEGALARAKKEGKLVFAYFTRSYYP